MEYVNLGRSGLKVSRVCLGSMSYGVPERGAHAWTLGEVVRKDEALASRFYRMAAEQGQLDAQVILGANLLLQMKYGEARPWLEKAAKQGSVQAKKLLQALPAAP